MESLCTKEHLYDVIRRILDQTSYKSYTLRNGSPSHYYINIDKGLISADLGPTVCECYVDRIETLKRRGEGIDRLAFIRRQDASQPTGALALMSDIVNRTKISGLIINLGKIGEPKLAGSYVGMNALIISDNATSGQEIKKVAKTLRNKGALVSKALVFFDREEGAEENLKKEHITLETVVSKSELVRQKILHELEVEECVSDRLDQLIKELKRYNPRWRGKHEKYPERLLVRRLKEEGFEVEPQVRLEKSRLKIDMIVEQFGVEVKIARKGKDITILYGQIQRYLNDLNQVVALIFNDGISREHIDGLKRDLENDGLLEKRVFVIEK